MKIRLTVTLPIDPKHGCDKGRVFETTSRDRSAYWILGDAGEPIKVLGGEYEPVKVKGDVGRSAKEVSRDA
ncbi:hypothetical protein [Pseudoalteromonas sp. Of7M-16]|uniref:hypothetical protein n=1 Tax=Pseudoalteromonas sp. Of7M-16 TaxID=2917756 RepID=UPI001EF40165|nr:hypothetical protein [Pseudoalteromonas sp. Of7M-16]MCG7548562.1 hypothetical protein [Pseudoalteromonas sp. Of7M-16]